MSSSSIRKGKNSTVGSFRSKRLKKNRKNPLITLGKILSLVLALNKIASSLVRRPGSRPRNTNKDLSEFGRSWQSISKAVRFSTSPYSVEKLRNLEVLDVNRARLINLWLFVYLPRTEMLYLFSRVNSDDKGNRTPNIPFKSMKCPSYMVDDLKTILAAAAGRPVEEITEKQSGQDSRNSNHLNRKIFAPVEISWSTYVDGQPPEIILPCERNVLRAIENIQ